MKVKTLTVPLYDRTVYYSDDLRALAAHIYKRHKWDIESTGHSTWGETYDIGGKQVAIWVDPEHKTRRAFIITLAHECNHAARMILRQIGEDSQPEELECRMQDWLLGELLPRGLFKAH